MNRTISGELRENSALLGVMRCYQEARAQDQESRGGEESQAHMA